MGSKIDLDTSSILRYPILQYNLYLRHNNLTMSSCNVRFNVGVSPGSLLLIFLNSSEPIGDISRIIFFSLVILLSERPLYVDVKSHKV